MPGLKSILAQQAAIPANLEASIPMLPKMSGALAQMANAVPVDLQLPDLPIGMGMGMATPFTSGITQVIKGVEDALPVGMPKVSESIQALTMGGYRPVEEKPANNNAAKRVMGSGYRSI